MGLVSVAMRKDLIVEMLYTSVLKTEFKRLRIYIGLVITCPFLEKLYRVLSIFQDISQEQRRASQ